MAKGILEVIASILLIIGGLNWALYAFNYNLVEIIFGTGILATIVYILVGLSALVEIYSLFKK